MTVTIYYLHNAEIATEGLQSSRLCDEAIITARAIARECGRSVIVEDEDECYRVTPAGHRWAAPASWHYNGSGE